MTVVFFGREDFLYRLIQPRSRHWLSVLVFWPMLLTPANAQTSDGRRGCDNAQSTECGDSADASASGTRTSSQAIQEGTATNTPNLFQSWYEMASRAQATEPDWLSPLVTTSGRLKNELRFDFWDQPSSPGNSLYEFGGNKGLELITSSRTQVLLGVPTYELQSPSGPPAGFGDLPLMLKFRIASANQGEGNYLLTFLLAATMPTGSRNYGAGSAMLTPALAFGKGWRKLDAQTTFGVNLPAGNTAKLGRQLQWNSAFQYRAAWKLWPELEVNSTFYETGKDAGDKQVFLTPGLGFGRTRVGRHFRFSSAAGMQIAATRFHTYSHRLMVSMRLSF